MLILVLKIYPDKKNKLLLFALSSLFINFLFTIKNPSNYLSIRNRMSLYLNTHPNASYFLIDSDELPETTYKVPGLNVEFKFSPNIILNLLNI